MGNLGYYVRLGAVALVGVWGKGSRVGELGGLDAQRPWRRCLRVGGRRGGGGSGATRGRGGPALGAVPMLHAFFESVAMARRPATPAESDEEIIVLLAPPPVLIREAIRAAVLSGGDPEEIRANGRDEISDFHIRPGW